MTRTCALSLLLVSTAFAAPPILHQDFEQDDTGWMVFGGEGKIQVTHDPAFVKSGKGAMEFRYQASNTKPALAVMPVRNSLAGMKSLNLWLMSDAHTVMAIALVERNGGRYAATFWLDANVWQRVELTPSDFSLATGADDPKDPDGKLDLDQIEVIGILDVSQTFGGHPQIAVEERSGQHKLWADDFEISSDAPAWDAAKPAQLIADFRAPQVNWITLGGADLKIDSSGAIVPGKALRIDTNQMADSFVVVTHTLPAIDLTGATHIAFDIAAEKPAHLILSFQEKSDGPEGPRYNADLEVPGGNKMVHHEMALSAFELDDDGPADADHKLDLDKLKAFSIINVTAAYTGEEGVNTVRIGKILATKGK